MLISVDPGKYATKAKSSTKQIYFPTRISSQTVPPEGNTYNVQFNNESYMIGEMAEQQDFDISKASIVHKLATYTAIALLQGSENRIQLVMGCPLNIYKNKDLKEEYKNFMLNEKLNRIFVNDIVYSFYIENILILPEGAGIVYLYPSLFKGKRVAVVDLGGLNLNFSIYDNYVPQPSSMLSLNLGSYSLETILINELNSKYGIVLNSQDAQYIIKDGGLKLNGMIDSNSTGIVKNIIQDYLSKVLKEIQRNNFNLGTLDVCFVGGTSQLVGKEILRMVPHAFIPEEADWANCNGFFKIGELKYG